MQLFRTILPTPLGDMLALSSDEGLCALEFTTVQGRARGEERLTRLDARLGRWFPPHEIVDRETPAIAQARRWLDEYFSGHAADISGLALDMRGAPFERRGWLAPPTNPPGQTPSYRAPPPAPRSPPPPPAGRAPPRAPPPPAIPPPPPGIRSPPG